MLVEEDVDDAADDEHLSSDTACIMRQVRQYGGGTIRPTLVEVVVKEQAKGSRVKFLLRTRHDHSRENAVSAC